MKNENQKQFTIKQNISLILRGLKIISSFPIPLLLSKTVSCVFNAAVPFINIYFSARILNELAGARSQNRLIILVLMTIGLNLIFVLIKSAIGRWSAHCNASTFNSMYKVLTDKLLSMDYIDIENPEIQQEFSEIRQHQFGIGFGLPYLAGTDGKYYELWNAQAQFYKEKKVG